MACKLDHRCVLTTDILGSKLGSATIERYHRDEITLQKLIDFMKDQLESSQAEFIDRRKAVVMSQPASMIRTVVTNEQDHETQLLHTWVGSSITHCFSRRITVK